MKINKILNNDTSYIAYYRFLLTERLLWLPVYPSITAFLQAEEFIRYAQP